jgi:electron transport complex protein RnfE
MLIASIRHWIRHEIRLPLFVLVIASIVTVIELLMNAFLHDLHKTLGIFIPLIVTNCAIIGRAEVFASKNSVDRALADGLFTGLGFTLALVVLGALRELIGAGTLFSHADLLFGDSAKNWTLHLISDYGGFLLALLPPGAFIGLGLMIAVKNLLDTH